MNAIDQHKITASWEQSLVPAPALIDSRTEQDWLTFLSRYASLINFYDSNNQQKGNWSPFLIKDPVFLLASISRTRFSEIHSRYLNTCAAIKRLLHLNTLNVHQKDLSEAFNILFNELNDVFIQIKQWIYFMQMTNDEYDLKTYTIYQTQTTFSGYYWALISLQQNLYITSVIPGISSIDEYKFYFFDAYEAVIWKANKGRDPYWKVLGLKNPLKDNTWTAIYEAIKDTGDKVFVFFNTLIKNAGSEYDIIKHQKSRYPDTTLLRSFVHLLKPYQDQLNGISQKHLNFYYKDILKQQEMPAVADTVYLCSTLAKTVSTFSLPAQTIFSAGLDAQKKPILFSTTADVVLNPAVINGGYTLSKPNIPNVISPFLLNPIPAPGVIQKDKSGKAQSWATFGGGITGAAQTALSPSIAFASPLLFLQEGARDIALSLTFSNTAPAPVPMPEVRYFLSTLSGWFEVSDKVSNPVYTAQGISVMINLQLTDPPIQAFQKINPDGIESQWPLLKLEFGNFTNTAQPPLITDLQITVTVNDVKTFQLYNDYGALSTKAAYQLFGPSPTVNNNFIIGSNEIFSKPFNSLVIQLNWDQLPQDFAAYYERYNTYIKHNSPPLPPPPPQSTPPQSIPGQPVLPVVDEPIEPESPPAQPQGNQLQRLVKRWFSKKYSTTVTPGSTGSPADKCSPQPFNNECFTVNFSLLQDAGWAPLPMNWYVENAKPDSSGNWYSVYPSDKPDQQKPGSDLGLFVPVFQQVPDGGQWVDTNLTSTSIFGYPPTNDAAGPAYEIDPSIQNTSLKFTDASTGGFMRMTLSGPETYGFGTGIYPDVISSIALTNAMAMLNKVLPENNSDKTIEIARTKASFSPAAKPPFVPKLTGFTGSYSATCTYQFTTTTNSEKYPVQCFLYTPFSSYPVYDNFVQTGDEPKPVNYNYIIGEPAPAKGIPLFNPYQYDGYLLLQVSGLVPATSFDIYFELARNYKSSSATAAIGYYYVSKTGWKKLPLLADGTNKFSCSGIVTVQVPDDIANNTPVMPGPFYWLCVAVEQAASFSQTVYFQSNAFMASRSSAVSSTTTTVPRLAANIITKPQTAIPQLAATVQPFASFGGEAAENYAEMNQRVSSRLLTKDRAVLVGDYPMMIRQAFKDIYFAKAVFDTKAGNTYLYVVKTYSDWTEPNAFLPLVTECTENKISSYLVGRASAFANIVVSNFNIQYVKVMASVTLATGTEKLAMQQKINHALNIFLSPWISSDAPQVIIGQVVTGAMVAKLLKNISGVVLVNDVRFQSWVSNEKNPSKWSVVGNLAGEPDVAPANAGALLVSCMSHLIKC